jgi:cytochrome bd-type quinol oxidase subunit 1
MWHSKIIRLIFTLIFTLGILLPATAIWADEYGLDATANAAGLDKFNEPPPVLAGNVIGAALSMIGVLFFILMVYGGILWMTARGNEDQSKKALNTIIAASIGLIIVLASYAITNFVLTSIETG